MYDYRGVPDKMSTIGQYECARDKKQIIRVFFIFCVSKIPSNDFTLQPYTNTKRLG